MSLDLDSGCWTPETPVGWLSHYHGGQGSMMYALSSTGSLSVGHPVYRRGRSRVQWLLDLVLQLINELEISYIENEIDEDVAEMLHREAKLVEYSLSSLVE